MITSLVDETKYPTSIFADLYHQRWGIEEDYKVMKRRLNIENFSGVSIEAILQDIHAKTLTKNLVSIEVNRAKQKVRKYQYKINVTHALNQLKGNVIRFLMGIATNGLSQLMIVKISQVTNAYRPERKFKRPNSRLNMEKYPVTYKRLC